ncbi:MAG: hypothetical protein KY468_18545, partial [Armatimonadetes bacterium]|nr:hypothetical protein [Armatimonadota bacterium]
MPAAEPSPAAPAPAAGEILLHEFRVLPAVGRYGRSAVFNDPLEARIVRGTWVPPAAGETMTLPDGATPAWETATAGADGWLQSRALRGGYTYASVQADSPKVMLLEASGHNMAYVNGVPRTGDPYAYEYVRLPIQLRKGRNDLLFHVSRGRLKAKLTAPNGPLLLDTKDYTLPDLRIEERPQAWGAVVVLNATDRTLEGLALSSALAGSRAVRTPLPPLLPYSARKVGFRIAGSAPKMEGTVPLRLRLVGAESRNRALDTTEIPLRVRRPDQTYKVTFVSEIDGSVQYYAVNPATPAASGSPPPALFLSL